MALLTANQVSYEYRNAYQTVLAVNGVTTSFEHIKEQTLIEK